RDLSARDVHHPARLGRAVTLSATPTLERCRGRTGIHQRAFCHHCPPRIGACFNRETFWHSHARHYVCCPSAVSRGWSEFLTNRSRCCSWRWRDRRSTRALWRGSESGRRREEALSDRRFPKKIVTFCCCRTT